MTESATPKPFFNRRRVIVGAVGVLVIVAAMGVWGGMFDKNPNAVAKAKFVGFQKSTDGNTTEMVLLLTNQSTKDLLFHYDKYSGWMVRKFVTTSTNGDMAWGTPGERMRGEWVFNHLADCTYGFVLPNDGRTGRLAVFCEVPPGQAPKYLHTARTLWWKLFPPRIKGIWITCDQEIQCPKVLPDGTVEPPRLISAPGAKP